MPASGPSYLRRHYPGGFDEADAAEIFGRHLDGIADDHVLELTHVERKRIFNLGYYTWVEQQGVSWRISTVASDQSFWRGLTGAIPAWDAHDRRDSMPKSDASGADQMSEEAGRVISTYLKLARLASARPRRCARRWCRSRRRRRSSMTAMTVGIGGSTMSRTPMAMIWALIRAGRKDLTGARAASCRATATFCSARAPATT